MNKFPTSIQPGFNFDEAITMAELSQRVYRIFEAEEERDPRQVYQVLYTDEWEFLHGIGDNRLGVRCMIVQRRGTHQYAVVFRGSVVTGGGIEWTNMTSNEDHVMVPFDGSRQKAAAQLRDIYVHRGFWNSYVALRREIQLFFTVLAAATISQGQVADLVNDQDDVQRQQIATIGAAVRARYDETVERRVLRAMTKAIAEIQAGEREVQSLSIEGLIANSSRLESVLAELASEPGSENQLHSVPQTELYVTGHSLGGVMAAYCALDLKMTWENQPDLPSTMFKVYTLGSPKPGNKGFAQLYNRRLWDMSHRVENRLDVAIRMPISSAPFPYSLQLLIPNVDYVRDGENYYANYEPVGEAYSLFNLGYQDLELNFGGPIRLRLPIPFPHGPDGYKQMLIEAQEWEERFWKPAQNVMRTVLQDQNQLLHAQTHQLTVLQQQIQALRSAIEAAAADTAQPDPKDLSNQALSRQIKAVQKQLTDLQKAVAALGEKTSDS